jgi:hypothetical protein
VRWGRGLRNVLLSLLFSALSGCSGCDGDDHDPDPVPPAAPTGLSVSSFTSGRVLLAWTDNSTNETGFLIERSPDGVAWTSVGTAAPNATAFIACGLLPGTTYFFRVSATGSGGSPPTAAVSQTTAGVAWGTPAVALPTGRFGHSAVYDPVGRRMIVFGGADGMSSLNDTWALDLSGAMPSWSALTVSGSPPPARWLHTAVYDSFRTRMLVFGGDTGTTSIANQNDVWELTLPVGGTPTWTQLFPATPQGAPGIRQLHTAVFDDLNDRMIVFGGAEGATIYDDAWALDVSASADGTWVPLATSPIPRWMHSAVYDSGNQRMVVFGGQDGGGRRNDVAALSLPAAAAASSWSTLLDSASSPIPASASHSAIYDAANCRMVVFGGDWGVAPFVSDQVWILTLSGPLVFSQASAGVGPPGRWGHTAVYDSDLERMIVFSGDDGSLTPIDDLAWPLPF